MNQIQASVFTALTGFSGLRSLIGTRAYPDQAPQGALRPYAVWQEISDVESNDLDGSAETGGLHRYRVQVTFWDTDATKSREGGKQVRLAMINASQPGSPSPLFRSIHLESRALPYEQDTKLFGMQSDFAVWLRT